MDELSKHKVLAVGDMTNSGFKLVFANSGGAVFQDVNGKLVTVSINSDISTSFNNHPLNPTESIKLNDQNQYITNIFINNSNTAIKAIIDTGANLVTLSSETANSLELNYKKDSSKVDVSTASDNTNGYKIQLNTVTLGTITMEGNDPEMVLVGMSFLKQLDLQYSGDHLELKKHDNVAHPLPPPKVATESPLPNKTQANSPAIPNTYANPTPTTNPIATPSAANPPSLPINIQSSPGINSQLSNQLPNTQSSQSK